MDPRLRRGLENIMGQPSGIHPLRACSQEVLVRWRAFELWWCDSGDVASARLPKLEVSLMTIARGKSRGNP